MIKNYLVRLSDAERQVCKDVIKQLKGRSAKVTRAQILLKADLDCAGWTDDKICKAYGCSLQTVKNVRKQCVMDGAELALAGMKFPAYPATPARSNSPVEMKVIATRLEPPPLPHRLWTLQLIEDYVVELNLLQTRHYEIEVKTHQGQSKVESGHLVSVLIEWWATPRKADAEFVMSMESVLDAYADADDPHRPVICMAERTVQLVRETRVAIPATKTQAERAGYEYERIGAANVFAFVEPRTTFRKTTTRPLQSKFDWALEVAHLLDTRYADCKRVTLICDNLETHTIGAFYRAFPPQQASNYVQRLKILHTPRQGSWLNFAACELSCLTYHCDARHHLGDLSALQSKVAVWSEKTDSPHQTAIWNFTLDDARIRLKRLYPKIKS